MGNQNYEKICLKIALNIACDTAHNHIVNLKTALMKMHFFVAAKFLTQDTLLSYENNTFLFEHIDEISNNRSGVTPSM